MKKLFLLLVSLASCKPSAPLAPMDVYIPQDNHPRIEFKQIDIPEKVTWNIKPARYYMVVGSISENEFYYIDRYKYYKVDNNHNIISDNPDDPDKDVYVLKALLNNNILTLECIKNEATYVESSYSCNKNGMDVGFLCHGLDVNISCDKSITIDKNSILSEEPP